MPRYFFHVHDGTEIKDEEGTVLTDLKMARVHAVTLASSMLREEPESFWDGSHWTVEVVDSGGRKIFRLDFTATDAPGQ